MPCLFVRFERSRAEDDSHLDRWWDDAAELKSRSDAVAGCEEHLSMDRVPEHTPSSAARVPLGSSIPQISHAPTLAKRLSRSNSAFPAVGND